jgi:hypothetical protein
LVRLRGVLTLLIGIDTGLRWRVPNNGPTLTAPHL